MAHSFLKVIKTPEEHEQALEVLGHLMSLVPATGSSEFHQLEILSVLIHEYEQRNIRIEAPSALEAIRFRMAQQGLSPRDLIPYLGSRSRVSEILAGKRSLTLPMIRALHEGLGIPADVLLQGAPPEAEESIDWNRFPLREMEKRGWIDKAEKQTPKDRLVHFFQPVGGPATMAALFRRTSSVRAVRAVDPYALSAWTAQILRRAESISDLPPFLEQLISEEFISKLVQASTEDDGPLVAQRLLASIGIILIIEPQLPKTNLDGAALLLVGDHPVIALTLRFDRIDNFWFTLMHELAHVKLHLYGGHSEFFDDLEVGPGDDPRELEADTFAAEALIPEAVWHASAASKVRAVPAVLQLAAKLRIHPAIVAGRMRHQFRDFRVLASLVGQGEVRKWFPENQWT
jgi:HTH-type transcriptional regulator / antitoxin HigA